MYTTHKQMPPISWHHWLGAGVIRKEYLRRLLREHSKKQEVEKYWSRPVPG